MAEPGVGLIVIKRILELQIIRSCGESLPSMAWRDGSHERRSIFLILFRVFFRWRVNLFFFSLLGYVLFYYMRQSHYRKILLCTPPSLIYSMLTLSLSVNRFRKKSFRWYFKKHLTYFFPEICSTQTITIAFRQMLHPVIFETRPIFPSSQISVTNSLRRIHRPERWRFAVYSKLLWENVIENYRMQYSSKEFCINMMIFVRIFHGILNIHYFRTSDNNTKSGKNIG